MFERVVLRRASQGSALTVGELANALLFYQNVHLIIDRGTLDSLIGNLGMPALLNLIRRPGISAVYVEEMLATQTRELIQGGWPIYSFLAFFPSGDQQTGALPTAQQRLEYLLERKGLSKRESPKLAEQFLAVVPLRKLTSDYYVKGGITKAATSEMFQPQYVVAGMRKLASNMCGLDSVKDNLDFEVLPAPDGGFRIDTNINFSTVNAKRKAIDPTLPSLTEAGLVNLFLDAAGDTVLAAHYGGDFYTSDLTSDLVRVKHAELLKRAAISAHDLGEFQDVVLPEYPAIREVVDSGQRSFNDFLKLLDSAERFRGWVRGVNPDAKLAAEYVSAVSAEQWMSSVPAKVVRYVLVTAAGLSPVAGAIAGAIDTFLLDKLIKGWRPSHFIDTKLKPFLDVDK